MMTLICPGAPPSGWKSTFTLSWWPVNGCGTPFFSTTWKSVWWMWNTCSSAVALSTVHSSTVPATMVESTRFASNCFGPSPEST